MRSIANVPYYLKQKIVFSARALPCNITWIDKKDEILFFDAGYKEDAELALRGKDKKRIQAFVSHTHEDHIGGISVLKPEKIYLSFQGNEKTFSEESSQLNFVEEGDLVYFDNHKIEILNTPGHSIDSLSFFIDDKILYVGDLLIRRGKEEILPYISRTGNILDHIHSLKKIVKKHPQIILCGHGNPIYFSMIEKSIEERVYYLEGLLENQGNTPVFSSEKVKEKYDCFVHKFNLQHRKRNWGKKSFFMI